MIRTNSIAWLFASVLISLSLLLGTTLHTLIPHNHHGDAPIWDSLHGSLHHEDKKLSLAVIDILFFASLGILSTFISFAFLYFIRTSIESTASPNNTPSVLRRGVVAYRKFR